MIEPVRVITTCCDIGVRRVICCVMLIMCETEVAFGGIFAFKSADAAFEFLGTIEYFGDGKADLLFGECADLLSLHAFGDCEGECAEQCNTEQDVKEHTSRLGR